MDTVTDLQPENGAIGVMHVDRGQVLPNGGPLDRFLMLRAGALKVEYLNPEGRPEVAAFLLPGEPVVTAFADEPVAITALQESWICDLDPERVHCAPDRSGEVLHALTHAIGAQAAQDQRRLILARSGEVAERLMWFLRDLSARQQSATVTLVMTRSDIAHYLETTAESVSRAFTDLVAQGAIVRERPRRIRLASA
ncbi:hypothetical protein AVJ23_19150 [Pseudoponticoccus marisrubri]|uniref:HTH crp-type domain-containing protein n=2 Tax=Pseudoponticoccus marisrubri TaxID=1685382 RepID=A0A0W7WF47_9RHOB|nr:hypothetical protein AVJ23_19150 [Pseudoponticoccus marisrubri]